MRKRFDFIAADQGILTSEEITHIRATVVETIHHKLIARQIFPLREHPDPGARFYIYHTETDPSDALIDMDGVAQADDVPLKTPNQVLLPVIYKTFFIRWRDILSSRRIGPGLIDDCVRTAAWQIADHEDRLMLSGECPAWLALGIEGFTTATGRLGASAVGNWPANALADINTGRAALQAAGFVGEEPILIGLPDLIKCLDAQLVNTSDTYRSFLLENNLVSDVYESANVFAADCVADSVVLVVPGEDNFYMVESMPPTTLLWQDKMDSVHGVVREIVAPVIPRPTSIYEIDTITCA